MAVKSNFDTLVTVFGGSGFVGRHVVRALAQRNFRVRVAVRRPELAGYLRPLGGVGQIETVQANLRYPQSVEAAVRDADIVINLVGILNEPGRNGAGFRRAHVEFTAGLLRAMQAAHVPRLLQMSALNADAEHGRSFYLRTKGQAEQLVRSAGALEWTIFRPSVIFGPEDSLSRRFANLLRLTRGLLPLARASARFAPIYVGDVAEAFMLALEGEATVAQTYELCGPEVLTLAQIVRLSAEAAQLPCRLLPLPNALARIQAALMDFLPGKPFSSDNYRSLLSDSVCRDNGCERLGLQPASFRAWTPLWLHPLPRP